MIADIRDEDIVLDSSLISLTPSSSLRQWKGESNTTRGYSSNSLLLDNTSLTFVLQERCVVNQQLCHNGHAVSFWLLWPANSTSKKQILYTTLTSNTSHGVTLFLENSPSIYSLGVEVREQENFTINTYPVSVQRWTNIVFSLSNSSDIVMYMNGRQSFPITSEVHAGNGAVRPSGEEVTLTVGSSAGGENFSAVVFANLTITEYMVLDINHLYETGLCRIYMEKKE